VNEPGARVHQQGHARHVMARLMTSVKVIVPVVIAIGLVAGCASTTTASPKVTVTMTITATPKVPMAATATAATTTQATATTSAAWPTIPLGQACDLRGPSSMNQAVYWPQVGGSIRA
jgi:hypothetical protein